MSNESAFNGLTNKQANFVDEYMKDSNAKQAAIRAGYSERSAQAIGARNMGRPNIRMAIAELRQDVAIRNRLTVDDLIQELEEARKEGKNASIAQSSAMVAATMGKAKMLGFLIESVDHTSKGEKIQSGLGHFYAEAEKLSEPAEDEPSPYPDDDGEDDG